MWDVISKEAVFDSPVQPPLPPEPTCTAVPQAADEATTSRPRTRSTSRVRVDSVSDNDSDREEEEEDEDEDEDEGDGTANKRIRVDSPSPVPHNQSSAGTTKSAAKALFGLRNDESEIDAVRDASPV